MDDIKHLVDRCLSLIDVSPPPLEIIRLEQAGELARQEIATRLASDRLSLKQTEAALRCLVATVRHAGVMQWLAVLQILIPHVRSRGKRVRTTAARLIMLADDTVRRRHESVPAEQRGHVPPRDLSRDAVDVALRLGVDSMFIAECKRFVGP